MLVNTLRNLCFRGGCQLDVRRFREFSSLVDQIPILKEPNESPRKSPSAKFGAKNRQSKPRDASLELKSIDIAQNKVKYELDLKVFRERLSSHEPMKEAYYRDVIVSACNAGRVYEAMKYYEELKRNQKSLIQDPSILDSLFGAVSEQACDLPRAIRLFQEFEETNRPISIRTFACMFHVLAMNRSTSEQVEYYYTKMKEHQITPTVNIYKNLILAFGLAGNPERAKELFHMTAGSETTLIHVFYNAMIEAYLFNQMFDEAIKVYEAMKNARVKLGWYTYAKLIHNLRNSTKRLHIKYLYEDAKKLRIPVNGKGFIALLDVAVKNDDAEFAKMLLEEVEDRLDVIIEHRFCNGLLLLALKADQPQMALNLYEQLKSRNIETNTAIYDILIEASLRCQNPCLALKYWIERKSIDWTEFASTANSLMLIFETAKTPEDLMKLYRDVTESHLAFDNQMMNCFIQHLAKLEDFSKTFELYKQFFSPKSMSQVSTIKVMLSTAFKDPETNYDALLYLIEDVKRFGIQIPNYEIYNLLLTMHAIKNDLTAAQTLLRQMNDEKLSPDTKSYVSLIDCSGRTKNLPMLRHLLESMEIHKVIPDDFTYRALVQAFLNCDLIQDARLLLTRLLEKKMSISGDSLLIFLDHAVRNPQHSIDPTKEPMTAGGGNNLFQIARDLWSLFHTAGYELRQEHYNAYMKILEVNPESIQHMKNDLAPHLPRMAKFKMIFSPNTLNMFREAVEDYISSKFSQNPETKLLWHKMLQDILDSSAARTSSRPRKTRLVPLEVVSPTESNIADSSLSTKLSDSK